MKSNAWRYGLLVALLAVGSSLITIVNDYAQDDPPAIMQDSRTSAPGEWRRFWSEPFWAEQFGGHLYRPLASTTLAAEWRLGGGWPVSYKVISVALYAAAAIGVYYLAFLVFGPLTALVAAMLFAVHPVHVEAVAAAVNQGEIIVCLLMVLATGRYIIDRRADRVTWRTRWLLFAATVIGGLYKETAAVLAGLIVAAEFTILLRLDRKWKDLAGVVGLQVLAVAVLGVMRYRVHAGNLAGTFTAESIAGATMWQRLLTMLGGVVPEWMRLLLWPANLQLDYAPQEIVVSTSWGSSQTLGLLIVMLIGWLAWRFRTRAPGFSFGVAWTAVALFPVSNVLVPTGIILAERTLITPSVGAMLAVAAVGSMAIRSAPSARRRVVRGLGVSIVAVVLVLGMTRSISRHIIWRNNITLWRQTAIDAPASFRARVALGTLIIQELGMNELGEQMILQGIKLWQGSSAPLFTLADRYRHRQQCEDAVPLYEMALAIEEFAPGRAALVACRAFLGQYEQGRSDAFAGMRTGYYAMVFRQWIRTIDVAIRTNAPPGTVRFPPNMDHLFTQAILEPGAISRTRVAKGVHRGDPQED